MSKPQTQCIFCDNSANSKEHIWPEWIHPVLTDVKSTSHNRHTTTKWPSGIERRDGPTNRQGGVKTIKVRCVCTRCNNGWMSKVEGTVRPFLGRMAAGEDNILLDGDQILALAKWCTLKFLLIEHASSDVAVTPRADCLAFKTLGVIPPYFRIYVGNHASKHQTGLMRHSHTLALSRAGPRPPLEGTAKNIQTTTILLGRLFIHLNAARVDDFEIEQAYLISRVWAECQIWPAIPARRKWPHRPLLNDRGLSMVARSLETILVSDKCNWIDESVKS